MTRDPLVISIEDEAATTRLAEDVAAVVRPGDLITLSGPLGAGKTTFARALLRTLADDPELEVPSPTYTLLQPYELKRLTIAHMDLYRLGDPSEAAELGIDELLEAGAVLMEWPEHGAGMLPPATLAIAIAPGAEADRRTVTLDAAPDMARRLERSRAVRAFLDAAGFAGAARRHLQGDASSRTYERIRAGDTRAVLMNAPTQPDGPAIYGGEPYSRRAHLAESVRPFVAIGDGLRARGYSAPEVLAHDLDAGLLLLEDLGTEPILQDGAVLEERYGLAVDVLADLHGQPMPRDPAVPGGGRHLIPPFDKGVFGIELSLYPEWFVPFATGAAMDAETLGAFAEAWDALWPFVEEAETSWLLRDYHSPNLMWLPERGGLATVGLLDYQDALIGPTAYDLASLAQDARVTVSADIETRLLARYEAARRAADPAFDAAGFRRAYTVVAAQRATKILGIFARLKVRDDKPAYLAHLPRIAAYLERSLADPIFAELRGFYEPALAMLARSAPSTEVLHP
ncbi:tRNA threonylcarbamoyl adenosine modification protein YjeE [Amorphus suaedae]